jgi:hypothetical protein
LIEELRDQINFLKSQIEAERFQNSQLMEQNIQWQKTMMTLQSENQTLRQEIEEYQRHSVTNPLSTSMCELNADEPACGHLYSEEKLNGSYINQLKDVPQTNGAQTIVENLLRKTFPWGMPARLPSPVKYEMSNHLAKQGLGISDSRLNSIVSSIRKNW